MLRRSPEKLCFLPFLWHDDMVYTEDVESEVYSTINEVEIGTERTNMESPVCQSTPSKIL
jgi:hypothetical protein